MKKEIFILIGKDHVAFDSSVMTTFLTYEVLHKLPLKHGLVSLVNVSQKHPEELPKLIIIAGVALVISEIATLIPDLDSQNSTASKYSIFPFYEYTNHHGIFHSLIGWAIFSILCAPLLLWHSIFFIAASGGYFLHLLADSWSYAGVMWTYPYGTNGQPDDYLYQRYGIFARPVHHYLQKGDKKIPCRHWWGRGYKVGSRSERKILKVTNSFSGLLLLWILYQFFLENR